MLQIPAAAVAVVLAGAVWRWGPRRRRPVYLLDFGLWRVRDDLRVTRARFMKGSIACGVRCRRPGPAAAGTGL